MEPNEISAKLVYVIWYSMYQKNLTRTAYLKSGLNTMFQYRRAHAGE